MARRQEKLWRMRARTTYGVTEPQCHFLPCLSKPKNLARRGKVQPTQMIVERGHSRLKPKFKVEGKPKKLKKGESIMTYQEEMASITDSELYEKLKHSGDFSWFRIIKNGKDFPFCLMCGRELTDERRIIGVWDAPAFKRLYVYDLCWGCAKKYRPKDFEEQMMLLLARLPRYKLAE